MGWDNPMMEGELPRKAQLALAMYAMHVWSGSSIFCKQVRYKTVVNYVNDAAKLMAMVGHGRDYRKDQPTDKTFGRILKQVYDEIQRYESVPNRREPVTPEMLREARKLGDATKDPYSLDAALSDWWAVAVLAGLRLCEWAQPTDQFSDPDSPHKNIFGDTAAFCLGDIQAELVSGQPISAVQMLEHPREAISKVWITFRTQKNGDHGEKRLFVRNDEPNGFCMVAAILRIIGRFRDLCGVHSKSIPLSVYRHTKDSPVTAITAKQIEEHMRRVAATVYRLNPKDNKTELQRWSSHSLRVGACVQLHTQGFSVTQIKFLLRWRSDAFMVYLRNTVTLSKQQNDAWNAALAMPNFV